MTGTVGKHITFVSPPFSGHLNPLLELATYAKEAGFEVSFITSEKKRNIIRKLGFNFSSLPTLSTVDIENIANPNYKIGSNPFKLHTQLKQSLSIAYKVKQELTSLWKKSKPDIVVADSVSLVPGLVANEMDIPWITTIATPFVIESGNGTPPYLGGLKEGNGFLYSLRNKLGYYVICGSKRLLAFSVKKELNALGVKNIYRPDGTEAAYSPYSILGFGIEELEFKRDWPIQFSMIGPLFKDFVNSAPMELPSYKYKVLITLGTHLLWAKKSLHEEISWLASKRPDTLFIGSLGDSHNEGRINKLSDNAMLVPFLSYHNNLHQFDVVIHHGGAGITNACIWYAIPSLVFPHDYDQFDYAARICTKGIGHKITSIKNHKTLKILDHYLKTKNRAELLEFQHYAKSYNPKGVFVKTLDTLCPSSVT